MQKPTCFHLENMFSFMSVMPIKYNLCVTVCKNRENYLENLFLLWKIRKCHDCLTKSINLLSIAKVMGTVIRRGDAS